jgi:hypothetical protein
MESTGYLLSKRCLCLFVCLFDSYSVSVTRLCPVDSRDRQLTRCGRESAPPHFTLKRAICLQRPAVPGFYLQLSVFRL